MKVVKETTVHNVECLTDRELFIVKMAVSQFIERINNSPYILFSPTTNDYISEVATDMLNEIDNDRHIQQGWFVNSIL